MMAASPVIRSHIGGLISIPDLGIRAVQIIIPHILYQAAAPLFTDEFNIDR